MPEYVLSSSRLIHHRTKKSHSPMTRNHLQVRWYHIDPSRGIRLSFGVGNIGLEAKDREAENQGYSVNSRSAWTT